jgi:hypothetical protein
MIYSPLFSTDFGSAAFFFIRLPLADAKLRYDALEIEDKKALNVENGIDFGISGQWAVFADYLPDYNKLFSGGFEFYNDDFPVFFGMVKKEEAIFAMYETDNCSGNLYSMKDGIIVRDFVIGFADDYDRNIGQLPYEQNRMESWMDITSFIETLLK